MIASIGAGASTPTPPPGPPPAPEPTEPQPPIDFSTIDTPQKAALLPSLNATIGASLIQGMVRAMLGGETFSAALDLAFGNSTTGNVTFSMADDTQLQGTLSGTLGKAAIQESWDVNAVAQTVTVKGKVGNSDENLQWTRQDKGWQLSGSIGTVAVNATCSVTDGNHAVLDGKIGNAAWHQDMTFVDSPTSPEISINGTLDGAPTGLSSMLDRTDSDDASLLATGSIGGTLVSATGNETEAFPPGPPPPPPDPGPPPPPPDND